MITETASFLQYGALGLLGLFMLGVYFLLNKVVDRFCTAMDNMSKALVSVHGEVQAARADVKRVADVVSQAQGTISLVSLKGGPNG